MRTGPLTSAQSFSAERVQTTEEKDFRKDFLLDMLSNSVNRWIRDEHIFGTSVEKKTL